MVIAKEGFFMIRDLHNQGYNHSDISRITGFNRRTVRKYLAADELPKKQKRTGKPSKLDPFKDYITERITAYPLTARRIHREIQEKGYTGGYTILKDYIRTIRPQDITPAILRFETAPGKQMQVDWGECGSQLIDGRKRKIYAFSAILGYSRMRYMEFTLSTDVYTLIQCHKNAFDYFGGIPDEILYDNIKTVIIKRAIRARDHTWNAKFEDFFTHHGFIPRVCKPYNPQTKGKVENSIKFMKKDFLLGTRFTSFPDMEKKLLQWCNRVNSETHGSTHEIPYDRLKEETLTPLGLIKPYIIRCEETRKILRDAYFSYNGTLYSVPYQYAGQTALLELEGTTITVKVGSEVICTHQVASSTEKKVRIKDHFTGLQKEVMVNNCRKTQFAQDARHSQPFFEIVYPDVEERPLSTYDACAGEVGP